jgi:hypothetical protein
MNVAEALCRATAVIDGYYLEVNGYVEEMPDDDFRELVATLPCPYPAGEDQWPLGAGWEEKHRFLTMPYKWFLHHVDEEGQLGYLESLDNTDAADILEAMKSSVVDAEVVSDTPKLSSPVNTEPGKALLAWLDGRGAPTHARFVALTLLLHRNTKTGHSWPSQSTIGGYTGLSVRSVMRATQWLEDEKVIERVKPHQHGGNRYASVVYRFTRKVPI